MTIMRKIAYALLIMIFAFNISLQDAYAKSSGGYSKPSFSNSSYSKPSFSKSPVYTAPKPSSSSYAKPTTGQTYQKPSAVTSSPPPKSGVADTSVSRSISKSALDSYDKNKSDKIQATSTPYGSSYGSSYSPNRTTSSGSEQRRDYGSWTPPKTWTPPTYANTTTYVHTNDTNPYLMWYLLDAATRNHNNDWFYRNQNTEEYRRWRQEADALAKDNADLKEKLSKLDASMDEKKSKNIEVKPDLTMSAEEVDESKDESDSGSSVFMDFLIAFILLSTIGGFAFFLIKKSKSKASTGATDMGTIGLASAIIKKKMGVEETQKTDRLNIQKGKVLKYDISPFVLIEGQSEIETPSENDRYIVSIGKVESNKTPTYYRLYVNDTSFFNIHRDKIDGSIDECRYFTKIDEVTPSSEEDWNFWLSDEDGSIGLDVFEDKSGQQYARQWGGLDTKHISPITTKETIDDIKTVKHRQMLYARSMGLSKPAPEDEFLLLETTEDNEGARVDIFKGIDINPKSVSLS